MTTKAKKRLLGASLIVGLAGAVLLILAPWKGPRIDRATAEKIQVGMTRGEVEAIIGAPFGDYHTRPYISTNEMISSQLPYIPPGERWIGNQGSIGITFSEDDRVLSKDVDRHLYQTYWDKVVSWVTGTEQWSSG